MLGRRTRGPKTIPKDSPLPPSAWTRTQTHSHGIRTHQLILAGPAPCALSICDRMPLAETSGRRDRPSRRLGVPKSLQRSPLSAVHCLDITVNDAPHSSPFDTHSVIFREIQCSSKCHRDLWLSRKQRYLWPRNPHWHLYPMVRYYPCERLRS